MATYQKGGSTDTWTFSGNVAVGGNLEVTGTEIISGDTTYGDAVTDSFILKGRLVTGTVAGSALDLGATYLYNEHIELRANVTDWTKAANFTGAYFRYGNTVKTTSYNLTGMELNVSSDAAVVNLSGLYSETQCKALAAGSTWTKVKGIEANLSLYDQTQTVAVTEAMCFYATIGLGSGYTAYTGLHGLVIETRDGSVGTRTLGSGIVLRNISPAEGTQTFTKGLQIAMAAVTGISLEGAMTTGISITGACTTGILVGANVANVVMQVGTLSSTAAVGQVLTDTNNRVISLFADTGAAALAGDAQILNARLVLLPGIDQTGAGAASVLRGHLRIAGADLTNSESKAWAGVAGVLEFDGTHTVGTTNLIIAAALSGTAEVGGAPTLTATGMIAGLHLTGKWTGTGYAPTGEFVGIYFQAHTQGFEHAFGFGGVGTTDGCGLTDTGPGGAVTHKIAVYIAGVGTKYIELKSIS